MNISEPFIRRPVATTLLSMALLLAGAVAYRLLPVAPLPQVEFPVIEVRAFLPGASPETMASAVATPLERQFGRIAGVTEMTSSSLLGSTSVVLQFDLSRSIDAAARDVQAAINAARSQLPSNLPNNPSYRKINPADAPIMILALTSDTMPVGRLYDAADSVLAQKLSQVEGVGQVVVGGGARPAVRAQLDPTLMGQVGIGLEDVRAALRAANANTPKGELAGKERAWPVGANDQLFVDAEQWRPVIVAYRNGAPVRLGDLGNVVTSVEDVRTFGLANGKRAVLIIMYRQPGANMIETADRVQAIMPLLQASIPPSITLQVVLDRTTSIRASFRDIQITLGVAIILVVLVVFVFLRSARATVIPSVAVPLSLVGTFGGMYLLGYSLDNLSLMALTISTGFVVDDAIVVLENITRYVEAGKSRLEAALLGSKEIGFTVLSMSTSLVAVFIPILLMGGLVGRLFREFAVTLTIAIAISLVVSLTATPMMCARFLTPRSGPRGALARAGERAIGGWTALYARSLDFVLRHRFVTLLVTLGTIALNVHLFVIVPKGFFPQQDVGRLVGAIQADQDISFPAMREKIGEYVNIVLADPAVSTAVAFTGGGFNTTNSGRMFISLKPLGERDVSADQVIARLRGKLARVPGAGLFLQAVQDVRIGGRGSNAQYQYTLQSPELPELNRFAPRVLGKMRELPSLRDVSTDQQNRGLMASLIIDRDTASRLGIQAQTIDETLYDAFGQRQVSTIFAPLNQYRVVLEVAPQFQQNPDALKSLYVKSPTGAQIPLDAFTRFAPRTTPLAVNHQSQFPSVTLSFNLAEGASLSDAVTAIKAAERDLGFPPTVRGSFQGTALAFQASLSNQPILILAALIAVYIVLGVLYESFIHPITILSTLPSAGVGAILALMLCKLDLDIIALIGIILLIGIVKKNAIMMIDFAIDAERRSGRAPADAIREACLLRFRPIMMTTMAAILGALPLAVGAGNGAELRRPLGVTIVGGLLVSQLLTLYTTPVVYLYLERLRLFLRRPRTAPAGQPSLEIPG